MPQESSESNFMGGLLLGGLLGITLGIVVSSGNLKEKIKDKLRGFELDDFFSRLGEAFEEGKKEAEKAAKAVEGE